jgi:predicted PurR-regulated permease PerM
MTDDANPPPPRPERRVHVVPLAAAAAWIIAITLFLRFFHPLKIVLLGFLAAAAVAAMLEPLSRLLRGGRGVRAITVGFAFLAFVGGTLFVVSWLLVEPVRRQFQSWPQVKEGLDRTLAFWGQRLGLEPVPTVDSLLSQLADFITGKGPELAAATADITTIVVIVLVFVFAGSIYLLAETRGRLLKPVVMLLPPQRRQAVRNLFADLVPRLRWWMIGTLGGMAMIGTGSYIGYEIIGLEFSLPLAVLMGLSEAVPTVGPAVAFAVTLFTAFSQSASTVVGVVVVYSAVQLLESYVVLPLIMRRAVDIPPVVTLFTVVLWGKIFGVAGLLLAVPIDLVIWGLLDTFIVKRYPPAES